MIAESETEKRKRWVDSNLLGLTLYQEPSRTAARRVGY